MKKILQIIGITLVVYGIGFIHGMNSDFVQEKIDKQKIETENSIYEQLISSSYGIINIEATSEDKEKAETDFTVRLSMAQFNHWTLIGERKDEVLMGGYRICQSAMRFPE